MSLLGRLTKSIQLGDARKNQLRQALSDGSKFYTRFNDTRMRLAFDFFSTDMKKALYEILFFLHVNDPRFEQHQYPAKEIQVVNGSKKEVDALKTINLYVEGAPAGVVGIDNLNGIFREDFASFVAAELGSNVEPGSGYLPIYSVASLGSIGTVGHKKTASDLDLQVQYELGPFLYEPDKITDQKLGGDATKLINYFAKSWAKKKAYGPKEMADPEKKKELTSLGRKEFRNRFPRLFDCLLSKHREEAVKEINEVKFATALLDEMIAMVKLFEKLVLARERKQAEDLLQTKIKRIQTYIQDKYPEAEVYLFAYSNDNYRAGNHGTTLESKEASGSAYEKILNYETLMPGIQFTPMVPMHFLLPPEVNADEAQYGRLVDYARFQVIDIYDFYRPRLVDLGSTPPLTFEYMMAHSGAIYWEAFKASSGNLPKAFMNLLRIEMLFDPRFNTSIIELIKDPTRFDSFIPHDEAAGGEAEQLPPWDSDFFADYGIPEGHGLGVAQIGRDRKQQEGGLSVGELLEFEVQFPRLLIDPWWLRYKALKIAFGPAHATLSQEEKDLLSRVLDMGFALHIKIAEVFDLKKPVSYRDQVLSRFLAKGFPEAKLNFLKHIFAGEVDAVNRFEKDLKQLFKASMARVQEIVQGAGGQDKTNRSEFAIWFHYYEKNFEPPPNQVRQDILGHLRQARGRLQMCFSTKKKTWYFKSLQKGSSYTRAGDLDHLPPEVELFDHKSFLHGIAHCIMNGYYGVYNKGTLRENRTSVEFDVTGMKLEKKSAETYCYVTPDMAVRLFEKITNFFPPQTYDYRDCITKPRELVDMFLCLNLLEFGRVSILYRDNHKLWWVDDFDNPSLEAQADKLYQKTDDFWAQEILYRRIDAFLKLQKFELNLDSLQRIAFWVNPNSLIGGGVKPQKKEEELAKQFKSHFMEHMGLALPETEEV